MHPTVKLDRTIVTVLVDEVVHVLLELQAPASAPLRRAPLDVVIVLDRSGSMSGAPIGAVTEATARLFQQAGADDRIGVVAFDTDVELVLPLDHHEPQVAAHRVRTIEARASTNLSGGWLKALEMLTSNPRPEALRRIVVLTDGHANHGITGAHELAALVKGGHGNGVTTSCIGFDAGYDEVLLSAMADAGMGNDYWCAGSDQAAQVFADEFGGLASVVAQNLSVEIAPTDAVDGTAVLNEFPVTEVPGGLQVALGDAYGGERRKVVAKFHLRAAQKAGPVEVATLTVRWAGIADDVSLHSVSIPLSVIVGDAGTPDSGADPEVTEEVVRLDVARLRREARDAAERGDYGTASRRLLAGSRVASSLPNSAALVRELDLDAERLTMGEWSPEQAKRHWARSRTSSRGRRSDYPTDEPTTSD